MASKFIIDDALISDMLNFSAKPAPTYRQAEDASMRGLESLLIPDAPGQPEGEAVFPQTAVSEQSFLDKLPFFTDTSKIDLSKEAGDRGRFDITEKNIKELGNAFKGIMDVHSEGLKQLDEDFADDPVAKNALKALGYLSTGTNLAITAGFSPFTVGTAYVGDLIANVTGDETTGRQLFRDLNTFLIGKGGEAPVTIKIPSKKGVVNATVNKDGSINVGDKTYGGDLNLNRAQFMELVRRETFGSARETGNLNLMPLREDGLPSPTIRKTEIPKVEVKDIPDNTPINVKPVPKKVAIDKGMSENEGVYMANVDGKNVDLKDKTFNTANISVTPEGVPKFDVQNVINRDIEKPEGVKSKKVKVNLFKKSAGWKWLDKPENGNDNFLVSIERGEKSPEGKSITKHYYTLNTDMTADTQLKYYPNQKSEPRLRPTAYDDLIFGNKVGEIDVRGKKHPVYDTIEVAPPKQAVGADVTPTVEPKYHPLDRVFKQQIREVLSTDLLSPQYLAKLEKDSDISCGQCYAAAEALYHKWGKFNGFTPKYLKSKDFPEGLPEGDTHWFLQNNKTKEILDPTAEQFGGTPIPYEKGTGAGFQTKEPAKNKGKEVLNRLGTEKVIQTPSGVVLDFANQKGIEKEGADLSGYIDQVNYDIENNFPERKNLGELKNITGDDPRFMVGFTTKEGNQGYITGYGTEKNVGFVEYFANLGTKEKASGETPSPLKPSELKEIINELKKHYGFRQFAGDRITGVRDQNRKSGQSNVEDLFAITPKPESAVDLMVNPFTADIAKSGKIKKEDIARFFDERPTRDINDPKAFKEMVNEAVDEIYYQLQQEVTGEGWYDEGVKKAMKIAEKINPKFKNNPDLKDLILFTTAIASSGVSVGLDFKVGLQVADIFADTGQIPLTNPYTGDGWTVRGSNLAKQLSLANNYIQKNGLSAFLEFLHTEMTGRELQNFRKEYGNLGPSKGVKMDEIYTGDRAFGPKIGEFMANLYGTADNNVVDMWNVRSMNRLIGDMFVRDKNGKVVLNNKGEPIIKDGFPTITMKRKFDEFMQAVANIIGKSVRDTQAIRWYFEQGLYTQLGKKSVPKDYGTAAQEVLEAKQSNNSPTGVSSSKTSGVKSKTPTKKAQGGSISIPQRRSLVNDGLVDINTIIGKINYGN
jgi:hypothetical protein